MAYNKNDKSDSPMKRRGGIRRRKKVCVFCGKDNAIDYKDTNKLKRYISERQDSSQKNYRELRKASESVDCCHQEGKAYRIDAICYRLNKRQAIIISLGEWFGSIRGCCKMRLIYIIWMRFLRSEYHILYITAILQQLPFYLMGLEGQKV